jgi:hypothetical protein
VILPGNGTISGNKPKKLPLVSIDVTRVLSHLAPVMQPGMQTFPQAGDAAHMAGIPVENTYFSTFSTSFSTTLFHRKEKTGYTKTVNINTFDKILYISIFCAVVVFTTGETFVQKFPP